MSASWRRGAGLAAPSCSPSPAAAAGSRPAAGTLPFQGPSFGCGDAPTQRQHRAIRNTHGAAFTSHAPTSLWPCVAFKRGQRSCTLLAAAGLGRSSGQSAGSGASTSQPQRSPGSNSQPLSTDLLIQRLEGVDDTQAVLQLLKQPRSAAAEQTFLFTAALKALARLLVASPASTGGAGSGRGGKSRTKEELQELQEAVRSMVHEVHLRRGVLSFPLLSDTLTSLEVLLPALGGWRAAGLRPEDAALGLLAMAADIPQAAADADNLRPVPLPLLRDAFRAALRLTQMAQQQTQQSPSAQVDAAARRVRDAVQANLRHAVFPAPGEGAQAAAAARLHGADLAAMAAAAELAVMWDVEVPPAVMQLHVGHVDQLLAAAAGPAYAHVTDVEAKRRAADADQGTSSSSSSDNDGPSTSYSAPGRGRGRATPRGRGGRGGGGRMGRGGAAPQGRGFAAGGTAVSESAEPPLPAELVAAAGQLDVTSLAQLLVAWASVPVGRPAPSPKWLDRAAALALRTQDPATMSKRGQLLRKLKRLRGERQQIAEQLRQLHTTTAAAERERAAQGVGAGGPGVRRQQQQQLEGSSDRLKAQLKDVGRDVEALQQELVALGPVASAPPPAAANPRSSGPAPAADPTPGRKRRQQQVEQEPSPGASTAVPAAKRPRSEQQKQQQPRAVHEQSSPDGPQPGYSLEPGVLTSLLWALSGRLGDRLAPETQALARAVAVTRTADFTSPQQMVAVLYSLGRMKSVPAREQVGEFTKRLRPHLESLSPADAVRLLQALDALGYNPPARPWQRQPPRPQNSSGSNAREEPMDEGPAPSGAEVVDRLMVMVEGLGAHGSSGVGLEAGARGLSAAPSGLLLELLRSCAAWSVPFPEDYMGALESVVEQRVLRSLPPDQINLLSTRAVAMATMAPDRGGSRTAAAAAPAVSSVANANADAMRLGLLEGVMLPLAATRQGFANGDMFCVALRDWMEVKGWEGITVDTATSLINSFAYSKSWALVPQLRKVMEGLMERALRLPVSQPREGSKLLLAVGRALRVMGDKMQCTPADSIADKVAPAVAPLLWPAIEQLSPKGPNASDVAAVVKGLVVEARWRVPISADGGGSSSSSSSAASEQATRQLLAELTAAAEQKLEGTRPLSFAWLFEGFAALQYRPSHDTLTRLYNAAAARLGERPAKAEEVVELLNSVTGMERVLSEPAAATAAAAPTAVGPAAPATGRRATPADELKARGRLLQQLALAALQEPALPVLVLQPEGLVAAIKQMAALGLRPPTKQWLSGYTTLLQGLLPQLSPTGLAHAAEGLALLGAAPPSAFLDVLLTRADKHGVNMFEPHALGLLLGGAHALRQNALAAQAAAESRLRGAGDDDEGEEAGADSEEADIDRAAWLRRQSAAGVPVVAPLSTAAQEAWGRAHAAFVSEARKSNPMPRYSRAQQLLVVSAVTSFELSRPPLSQQAQTAAAGGAGKAGRGSAKLAAAASATTDFRARLEAEWLAETCASLLASRKAVGLTTAGGSGGISAALLPTPAMLESLLRLASRVLGGRTDGAIACLVRATSASEASDAAAAGSGVGSSAAAAGSAATSADEQALAQEAARSNVLEFVRLSIQDLSRSTGHRWTTSFPAWISLLRAALQAGIRLSPSELGVFASALLNFAARRTRRALTAKGSGSTSATDSGEPQAASGGSGAAKALSPEGAELMAAVWQDLEEGLEGVLLPVLPWVPPPDMLRTLRFGLLEQPPAVLTGASLRQLALMCTYVTQAAPQLAADASSARRMSWWANVRAELQQRAQDEEVEKAWAKVQRGSSSGGGSSGEVAEAALQTAGDFAAVCYGLLMHGGSGREGRDSRASGSAGAAPSGAALPDELAAWMRLLQTRAGSAAASEIVWSPSSDERLVGLRALQLLWVARAVGCLHVLPRSVWGAAFGALGPERLNSKALLPRQLAQLVALRSEALRGSSTSAEGGIPQQLPTALPPVPVAGWFLDAWLGQVATSCRRLRLAKRAARAGAIGDADGIITPAVAALAVAYCQPPTQKPPQYAVVLASAALPALAGAGGAARSDEALCLADVWAFLRRVEPWPVTGSGNAGDSPGSSAGERTASWTGLPAAAVAATCQRILAASKPEAEDPMRPSEAVQFTVTLLNAAAVNGSSSSGGANALEAALPLLQALVPAAEAEVWALAARECLGRAVLASALQAGLNAVTNTEPPLGADGTLASAREVAALVVGSVAVLLQQLPLPLPQPQAAGSRAASASVLDARNLPPGELAPLASAIIRLCPAATGAGDGAAPRTPRAAAAVLLRLLSTAEVVERLPVARLEAALTRFLPAQHHQDQAVAGPLPMTEAVAQAISAKLQVGSSASFARTPVSLAVQLHRCGASGVLLQRALLAERDWAGREVALLQALALAAPREPLALSLRNYGVANMVEAWSSIARPNARAAERGEGPFGCLALDLTQSLRRSSKRQGLRLAEASACMSAVAEVLPRLEGTAGSYLLHGAVATLPLRVLLWPSRAMPQLRADPAAVWQMLEALLALAGQRLNERAFAIVMRKLHMQSGNLPPPGDSLDAARDQQRFEVQQEEYKNLLSFIATLGPYLMHVADSRVLLAGMQPTLERHQQRMAQLLRGESVATAAASSPSGGDQSAAGTVAYWWPPGSSEQPPPGGLLGLQLPEGDPDLLSARQLGLLYGAVAIRGRGLLKELPRSGVAAEIHELYLAYVTALNLLAGRTDLPPHEHLAAMLGALEPVVFANPHEVVLPDPCAEGSAATASDGVDGEGPAETEAEAQPKADTAAEAQLEADTEAQREAEAEAQREAEMEAEPNRFYSDRLPFERFLAPVLARCAQAGAAEQPRPAGVELWHDVNALYGLADLSEQSMMAGLYRHASDPVDQADGQDGQDGEGQGGQEALESHAAARGSDSTSSAGPGPQAAREAVSGEAPAFVNEEVAAVEQAAEARGAWAGTPRPAVRSVHEDWVQQYAVMVALPTHLRLPPGRRHGQPGGDPAADAAREAYVRSVAPSFELLRRLLRMAVVTGRRPEILDALEAHPGFEGFGAGRWARLLEFVVALDQAQERADAEEEAMLRPEAVGVLRSQLAAASLRTADQRGAAQAAGGSSSGSGSGNWGGALQRMAADLMSSVASGVLAEGALGSKAGAASTEALLRELDDDGSDVAAAEAEDPTAAKALPRLHGAEAGGTAAERQPSAPDTANPAADVDAEADDAGSAARARLGSGGTDPAQAPAGATSSPSSSPTQVNPFEVTADFKRRVEALGYQVPERGAAAGADASGRGRPPGQGRQAAAQDAEDVAKAMLDAAAWVGGALSSYLSNTAQSVRQGAASRLSAGRGDRGPVRGTGGAAAEMEAAQEQEVPAIPAAPAAAADDGPDSAEEKTSEEGGDRARLDEVDEDSWGISRRLRLREAGPSRPQGRGFGKSKKG
ncbi:hypothetical protein HXX76_012517 [Chlamydomonas incerta]|uniref:Uncharacterized protein n=1 Tax=Chlamydomonas incerta TaxID=51695 RepID=A0A835SLP2_CHLIN|nr:hypothetical protein HXX76_012517 [Chlamydomonas incerta]|eukprot:KAG2427322.1 hypothetical protein HXX76_012517 [Chlamydomonas incerta]